MPCRAKASDGIDADYITEDQRAAARSPSSFCAVSVWRESSLRRKRRGNSSSGSAVNRRATARQVREVEQRPLGRGDLRAALEFLEAAEDLRRHVVIEKAPTFVVTRSVFASETTFTISGICSMSPCRCNAVCNDTYAGRGAVRYSGKRSGSSAFSSHHVTHGAQAPPSRCA